MVTTTVPSPGVLFLVFLKILKHMLRLFGASRFVTATAWDSSLPLENGMETHRLLRGVPAGSGACGVLPTQSDAKIDSSIPKLWYVITDSKAVDCY